eukprot:gene81-85_t
MVLIEDIVDEAEAGETLLGSGDSEDRRKKPLLTEKRLPAAAEAGGSGDNGGARAEEAGQNGGQSRATRAVKKGFLNDDKAAGALYGEEGSSLGRVTADQKQAWAQRELDGNLNQKCGMGEFAGKAEKPNWFNSEWPSNCQYNNPGCSLDKMGTTKHE